ncbi:MAG: hypothetical protein ACREM6_10550 [Vulcanimicrobiaceae bacterium]
MSEGRPPADPVTLASFGTFARPPVLERIARACRRRIALIVAPAGYGKSVSLAQFLSRRESSVSFAVRREHVALPGFARGLAQALATCTPGFESRLPDIPTALAAPDPPVALATWFASRLTACSTTIAIDDLHLADRAALRFVVILIGATRTDVRWILASRSTFDLPYATWLAYDQADDLVGEDDLRITEPEADAIARACGVVASRRRLKKLVADSNGWPVAFMLALQVSLHPHPHAAVEAREALYAYLADALFIELSSREQRFLLDTALLPLVDLDALAEAGWAAPHEIYFELRRRASFIKPESATTFRYHDLFRDFLDHRLRSQGVEGYQRARRAAATLLEAGHSVEAALRLRIEADDREGIVRMLRIEGKSPHKRLNLEAIEAAFAALSETVRRSDAVLCALQARVHSFRGEWGESDALYRIAMQLAADETERAGFALSASTSLEMRCLDDRALELLAEINPKRIVDPAARGRLLATRAIYHARRHEFGAAEQLANQAIEITATADVVSRASALYSAGLVSIHSRRLAEARARMYEVIPLADRLDAHDLTARIHHVLYSISLAEGDWDGAADHIAQAIDNAKRWRELGIILSCLESALLLATVRGQGSRADEIERELTAERLAEWEEYGALSFSRAMQQACTGNFAGAYQSAQSSTVRPRRTNFDEVASSLPQMALYAAAAGQREAATATLQRAESTLAKYARSADGEPEAVLTTIARVMAALAQTMLGDFKASSHELLQLERAGVAVPALYHLVQAARSLNRVVQGSADRDELDAVLAHVRDCGLSGYADLLAALPLNGSREAVHAPSDGPASAHPGQPLSVEGTPPRRHLAVDEWLLGLDEDGTACAAHGRAGRNREAGCG